MRISIDSCEQIMYVVDSVDRGGQLKLTMTGTKPVACSANSHSPSSLPTATAETATV